MTNDTPLVLVMDDEGAIRNMEMRILKAGGTQASPSAGRTA